MNAVLTHCRYSSITPGLIHAETTQFVPTRKLLGGYYQPRCPLPQHIYSRNYIPRLARNSVSLLTC